MGRPKKYNPEKMLPVIEECAGKGYTDKEVAGKIGIGTSAFYEWLKEFPEFSEAIKRGKKVADNKVEQKLYKRALGYKYKETTKEPSLLDVKKLVKTKVVIKHLAPDIGAIKMWLCNRKPKEWRDKQDINLGGEVTILKPGVIKKPADAGTSE